MNDMQVDDGRGITIRGGNGQNMDGVERLRPERSKEGYVIIVRNIHEEASEDDVKEFFGEYGFVTDIHLNLDRRTGYVKGYALIEYESLKEAQDAVDETNGKELLGTKIQTDFTFVKSDEAASSDRVRDRHSRQAHSSIAMGRNRSRSPSPRR